MDERSFQLGVAVILVGGICFAFGHLQGKGAGQAMHAAEGGKVAADAHYAFVPGGTNGNIEVLSLPSGQRLTSIPVLETAVGRAYATAGSAMHEQLISSGSVGGDLVRVVAARGKDGQPDGKILYAIDRANNRVAKIRLDTFRTEKVSARLPGVRGAGDAIHLPAPGAGTLIVTGEYHNGDGGAYIALLDPDTLAVRSLMRVPGNAARCAVSGDWLLVSSYGSEAVDGDDHLLAIHLPKCAEHEKPVIDLDGGKYRCLDLSEKDKKKKNLHGVLFHRVPVPGGAMGVTATPDGKYAIVSCRNTSNVAIVELAKLGQVKNLRAAVIAEPVLGAGPITTVATRDGSAYTLCFERSELVSWNVAAAAKGSARYVQGRSKVRYNPTDLAAVTDSASGETTMLLAQGASSLDQFLPVGSASPASLTLFAIDGGAPAATATLPIDTPTRGAVVVAASQLAPYIKKTGDAAAPTPGVTRDGAKVIVSLVLTQGGIAPATVELQKGDEVTLVVHNAVRVPGFRQGLVLGEHGVIADVAPGDTHKTTFEVGHEGTFWYYTTRQTALGTADARGRMIVKAKAK